MGLKNFIQIDISRSLKNLSNYKFNNFSNLTITKLQNLVILSSRYLCGLFIGEAPSYQYLGSLFHL